MPHNNAPYMLKIQSQYGIGQNFACLYLESWFGDATLSEAEAAQRLQDPTTEIA
jgi:hypothetical protein